MKILKKGLAAMLAACMLLTMLPAALAAESADPETAADVQMILCNLGYMRLDENGDQQPAWMPVWSDAAIAQEQGGSVFEADGSYTIQLEDNAVFPYQLRLEAYDAENSPVEGGQEIVTFEAPDSEVTFAGHTFRVAANNPLTAEDAMPVVKTQNEFDYVSPLYLLPVPTQQKGCTLNLLSSLPLQIRSYKLSDIWAQMTIDDSSAKPTAPVLWSADNYDKSNINGGNGNYSTYTEDATIDLTKYSTVYFIAGSGDQLASDNTLYKVQCNKMSLRNCIEGELYVQNQKVTDDSEYYSYPSNPKSNYLYMRAPETKLPWDTTSQLKLKLATGSDLDGKGYTFKVYTGFHETKDTLAQDITDQIWNTAGEGYSAIYNPRNEWETPYPEFTLAILSGSEVVAVEPFRVEAYSENIDISGSLHSNEVSGGSAGYFYYRGETEDNIRTLECTLNVDAPYNEDSELWLQLSYNDPTDENDQAHTTAKYAVLGSYTAAEVENIVKGDASKNYCTTPENAKYSAFKRIKLKLNESQIITIVNSAGTSYTYRYIVTKAEEPTTTRQAYQDVYFRVFGSRVGESGNDFHVATNTSDTLANNFEFANDTDKAAAVGAQTKDMYLLPYQHDSYYDLGFQTVFVNDTNFDLTKVRPIFYAYGQRKVYAGSDKDQTAGETAIVESGKNETDFSSGNPVPYSVVGKDGYHLKNYWVTFVKKQTGGAKLFVNGANDQDESYQVGGGVIKRDVFLDTRNGNEHDIFIANIGDADLTNLTVTLTGAKNIKLDDYWNIKEGSTHTLPAFSRVSTHENDPSLNVSEGTQLPNVAKIRLLKADEVNGDDIEGTLTIEADGGQKIVFQLTGTIGTPRILTRSVPENPTAVQYVHYSMLIQHNNRYRWNHIKFELTEGSKLPEGLALQENGEIYGVPKEAGEFHFGVRMTSDFPEGNDGDTVRDYVLTVLPNTDENVDAASMDEEFGYEVLDRIPDRDTYSSSELFRSEGIYSEYEVKKEVRIDGEKLEEGVDYDSEEGSTKITVRAQTLSKLSRGTHTLSVEFRSGKTMKRSAQNFKKGSGSSSSSSSNKGSSGGGGGSKRKPSSNTNKTPTTPSKPSTPSTPSQPKQSFNDVPRTDWSFNDVEWANTNGLMVGIGNEQFGPTSQISDAMVVSVLARLAKADLSAYTSASFEDIADGQWYSSSASWARAIGIIGSEPFQAAPPCPRGDLAVMLVRYFDNLKIPYSVAEEDVYLADAEQMNADELKAFQILVKLGIIKGKGNNTMDPAGATTRAELAALLHRVSDFVTASGR